MPLLNLILFVLVGAARTPAPPSATAVHVVIETERVYMGAVTKGQVEYWLAPDRTWVSRRGRITITRRDLGVRWRLDPSAKTYVEDKLRPPSSAPAAAAAAPGTEIHSARFDYEPQFAWTVTPSNRVTVASRTCREFSAEGHADYAETRLPDRYHVSEIRTRVTSELEPRDRAWRSVQSRRGRVYIIDTKAAGQYLDPVFPATGFPLGIGRLYPDGIDGVKFDDVELSRVTVPLETAQLYYVRLVDTAPRKRDPGFTITGQKQADGSYVNATVTTPLFTLKAPRVRVRVSPDRIKVQVLSRVKGG